MAEPIKNLYSLSFFGKFIKCIKQIQPTFNENVFLTRIYDKNWNTRELKERVRHITNTLHTCLSGNFEKDISDIIKTIPILKINGFIPNMYEFMFYPDFIECYGQRHYNTSVKAIEIVTQFVTCEFAVRPFIVKYQNKMLHQMLFWTSHPNEHVRRLASEGSRSRLPWAKTLSSFKKNPTPIIPILEKLKNDNSQYVRKSVANSLNDISKDHPKLFMDIVKSWKGKTQNTDKLLKHSSRTLLKQGNQELMQLFGFSTIEDITIDNFKIDKPNVKLGYNLIFSFKLTNASEKPSKIRMEYKIYYQKANGSLKPKIYKISEKTYSPKTTVSITKTQSFKQITTRKFYLGTHRLSLVINGNELHSKSFNLT